LIVVIKMIFLARLKKTIPSIEHEAVLRGCAKTLYNNGAPNATDCRKLRLFRKDFFKFPAIARTIFRNKGHLKPLAINDLPTNPPGWVDQRLWQSREPGVFYN